MVLRFLSVVFLFVCFDRSFAQSDAQPFVIDAGDTISISVYNEPDLNVRVKVEKLGQVKMPLIGNIYVRGKTTQQLAEEIEQAYFDGYLVNPSVAIYVEKYRPIYIRGAVVNSGAYDFEFDLTVDQAIASAGGLKDRASKKNWYIIRGVDKQRLPAEKSTLVFPGDIIEIKESLFWSWMRSK